jgi:hypothetical protein
LIIATESFGINLVIWRWVCVSFLLVTIINRWSNAVYCVLQNAFSIWTDVRKYISFLFVKWIDARSQAI